MAEKLNPFNSPDPTERYQGEGLSPFSSPDPTKKFEQEVNPFNKPDPTGRYADPKKDEAPSAHEDMKDFMNEILSGKLDFNSTYDRSQAAESGTVTESTTQIAPSSFPPVESAGGRGDGPDVSSGGGNALGPVRLQVNQAGTLMYRNVNCGPASPTP